jgi:hypothetical protein
MEAPEFTLPEIPGFELPGLPSPDGAPTGGGGTGEEVNRAEALAAVNEQLAQEVKLLGERAAARDISNQVAEIERDLAKQGVELLPAEREGLRLKLESIEADRRRAELLENLKGPQEELMQTIADLAFLRSQEAISIEQQIIALQQLAGVTEQTMALNQQFKEGAISAEEYARALEKVAVAAGKPVAPVDELTKSTGAFTNFARDAFQKTADAIVEFAVTGEGSFKEFSRGLLEELKRILAQKALLALLDAFTGGGASAGTALFGAFKQAQEGADTRRGEEFIVGEEGPELFTAPGAGRIVPAGETAAALGGAQQAPVVNVSAPPATVNVVNVSDPDEVPAGIESPGGEQAVLNVIRKKRRTVGSMVR